jgi:hypothetical protein
MLHNKSFQDVETTFKIDNSHIETGWCESLETCFSFINLM